MDDFNSIKEIDSLHANAYIVVNNPAKGLKNNKKFKIKLSNVLTSLGIETSTSPYTVYSALLNQGQGGAASTSAPVATELQNTIGAIVWTRGGQGYYEGTLVGAFTADKTFVLIQNQFLPSEGGGLYVVKGVAVQRVDADTIAVYTSIYNGAAGTQILDDAVLLDTSIEIRVYN
jgi:hypothetical protein